MPFNCFSSGLSNECVTAYNGITKEFAAAGTEAAMGLNPKTNFSHHRNYNCSTYLNEARRNLIAHECLLNNGIGGYIITK